MKVTVDIDCTPEEARRFMGLPDLTPANDVYVDQLKKAMQGATNFEQMEHFARQMAPMGQMGLKLVQQMMEAGAEAALRGSSGGRKPKD